MTTILQRFRRVLPSGTARRALLVRARDPDLSDAALKNLVEEIDRQRRGRGDEFSLAFSLGQLCERLADRLPREQRAAWLTRAVQAYQDALTLADAGRISGHEWIPETGFKPRDPAISPLEQVGLATAFHLGVLLCADFRVRDPLRAVPLLRRVAERVSGYHPAWYYLGEAHLLAGQFDAAERAWREGLARAPEDEVLRSVLQNLPVDRVHARAKAGHWAAVLDEIQRLPDEAMPEAERRALEGDAHHELGDRRRAAALYRAAIQADPHVVDVRRKLRRLEREGVTDAGDPSPEDPARQDRTAMRSQVHYNENHARDRI